MRREEPLRRSGRRIDGRSESCLTGNAMCSSSIGGAQRTVAENVVFTPLNIRWVSLSPAVLLVCLWAVGVASSAHAQTLIPDAQSCRSCSIASTIIATLGASEGPGALSSISGVSVDSKGRYWLFGQGRMPSVFGPRGDYIADVGKKGNGPGELMDPYTFWQLPGDSVAVFQAGGKVSIFDASLQFKRSLVVPFMEVFAAAIANWPRRVIINGQLRTARGIGWPLHTLDLASSTPRVIASFGPGDGSVSPISGYFHTRNHVIPPDSSDTFWAVASSIYRITQWHAVSNARLLTLERRPRWFAKLSNGLPGGPDKPPSPKIQGASKDEFGMLWVFALVPSPTFRQAWSKWNEAIRSGMKEVPGNYIDYSLLYDTRVEVLNLQTRRVHAVTTLRGNVLSVLPTRRVAFVTTAPDSTPRVIIQRLEVRTSADGGDRN